MRKYTAFYDELFAAVADTKHGTDEQDLSGDRRGGDFAEYAKQKRSKTLRWLKVLFQAMVFLLLFQLLLGWAARSIALLADVAHSGSDVVSYGLNWFVEWCKPSHGSGNHEDTVSAQRLVQKVNIIDTVGCLASLLILISTTGWAASEAWYRLQLSRDSDSAHVGSALLAFAAVSAVVNIGLLRMYQWSRANHKENTSDIRLRSAIGNSSSIEKAETSIPMCLPCKPATSKFTIPAPAKKQITLPVEAGCPAGSKDAENGSKDVENGVLSSLHMMFHPGCQCLQAPTIDWSCQEEPALNPEAQTETAHYGKLRNLNSAAAMIHLVSDMLRSVLLLVVGVLIQSGTQDAQYADALCGLVVSLLVCMGSMALLLRMAGRLHRCCGHLKKRSQSQEAHHASEPEADLVDSAV